jgi:hypothetical protein
MTPLESSAYHTLKKEMQPSDFNMLDWRNLKTDYLNNREYLLKIPNSLDESKTLFYIEKNGLKYFNWVQFQMDNVDSIAMRTINIFSVKDDKILHSYNIINNANQGLKINQQQQSSSHFPIDM